MGLLLLVLILVCIGGFVGAFISALAGVMSWISAILPMIAFLLNGIIFSIRLRDEL